MPAPENTIFYFDLATQDIVSKKAIVKQVNKYIKAKEKENPESNWGVVVFQHGEDNPQFHDTLAQDEEGLEPFLQNNLKFTDKAHPIEQGLMLASTYLIEAYRNGAGHVLRVIVISDGPSEGSNRDLLDALMNLLDNLKYFMYIDIIRVGDQRVYPDDIKLKMITDLMRGNVHYATSDDAFKSIMNIIGQEKPATKNLEYNVPEEKRPFFEDLCWKLVDGNANGGDVTCIICNQGPDDSKGGMRACEKCGISYHVACAQKHSMQEGDPLLGMFRCKKCHCLIVAKAGKTAVVPVTPPTSRVEPKTPQKEDETPDRAKPRETKSPPATPKVPSAGTNVKKESAPVKTPPTKDASKDARKSNASEKVNFQVSGMKPALRGNEAPAKPRLADDDDDEIKVISVETQEPATSAKKSDVKKIDVSSMDDQDKPKKSSSLLKKKK
jgi:hypothetical protein